MIVQSNIKRTVDESLSRNALDNCIRADMYKIDLLFYHIYLRCYVLLSGTFPTARPLPPPAALSEAYRKMSLPSFPVSCGSNGFTFNSITTDRRTDRISECIRKSVISLPCFTFFPSVFRHFIGIFLFQFVCQIRITHTVHIGNTVPNQLIDFGMIKEI